MSGRILWSALVALLLVLTCGLSTSSAEEAGAICPFGSQRVGEDCIADIANRDDLTKEQAEEAQKSAENHAFQAEVTRLMDIIINSLYAQKEVFLRELISNAADALEKIRFLAVGKEQEVLAGKPELEIRISVDETKKTVTITDSGVGMTKNDMINNLGTVAKSGTSNFLEALAQEGDVNLIGQFGVGFYSAYLVADKVTVISKHNDDQQHVWESSADGSFTVFKDPRGDTLGRGTSVVLHLKPDAEEYLQSAKLKELALRFSQFISFPIYVQSVKEIDEPVVDLEKEDEDKTESKETLKKSILVWDHVNNQKALWLRPKEEISEQEYEDFYKSVWKEYKAPLAFSHFSAEGEIEFKSIIYIPDKTVMDASESYFSPKQTAIRLYSHRVLVADEMYQILPNWLTFVKGVVDSDDLPLKVDRESLAQQKVIRIISKKLVRKFLETVKQLSKEDQEQWEKEMEMKKEGEVKHNLTKFERLLTNYGKYLRIGCMEDDVNREKIAKILRFRSSNTDLQRPTTSLGEYVERAPEDQDSIYYVANDNVQAALDSPKMAFFTKQNKEVLILTDAIDEHCLPKLGTVDGKKLVNIEKEGDAGLPDEEKQLQSRYQKYFAPLVDKLKETLKDAVMRVKVSTTLDEDPAAVVSDMFGYSAYAERIMRAQAFQNPEYVRMFTKSKVLEINPKHPIIQALTQKAKDNTWDTAEDKIAQSLFEAALVRSGYMLENPKSLARAVFQGLQKDLGIPENAGLKDVELPPEDEANKHSAGSAGAEDEDLDKATEEDIDKLLEQLKEEKRSSEKDEL